MTTATATKTVKPVTFNGPIGRMPLLSYVDPCPGMINTDRVPEPCNRCDGTGYTPFRWVVNGVCFNCNGSGVHYAAVVTVRKRAKQDAYYADYAAEIAAHHAAIAAANEAAAKAEEFAQAWDAAHVEKARRDAMVQGFLGQVGDKVSLTGTVQVAKYIEGSWNRSSSMFIVVKGDNGQVVKTFGSSKTLFGLQRGYRATVTGTVKAHETYQGQDQTVLTRVKAEVVLDSED